MNIYQIVLAIWIMLILLGMYFGMRLAFEILHKWIEALGHKNKDRGTL